MFLIIQILGRRSTQFNEQLVHNKLTELNLRVSEKRAVFIIARQK